MTPASFLKAQMAYIFIGTTLKYRYLTIVWKSWATEFLPASCPEIDYQPKERTKDVSPR